MIALNSAKEISLLAVTITELIIKSLQTLQKRLRILYVKKAKIIHVQQEVYEIINTKRNCTRNFLQWKPRETASLSIN